MEDFGQRNNVNSKCYDCKWMTSYNKKTQVCTNKYICQNNDKLQTI